MLSFFVLLSFFSFLLPQVASVTYSGADFSSLLLSEKAGVKYKNLAGTVQPFETILAGNGVNLARIRVWTAGDANLNNALTVAKRAANAGMQLMVDLHYSDTWADPGKQGIPSGWATDLSGLNSKIYSYTMEVLNAFKAQGLSVAFVQIGNEINDGMLWPTGQISKNGYGPLSELLHSAAAGARAASSGTKIVIHVANGWNKAATTSFFSNVLNFQGKLTKSDFDVIGLSLYPFYNSAATLSNLKSTMNALTSAYSGKAIQVVETNWPAICTSSSVHLSENYPASEAGQKQWMNALDDTVKANGGNAVIYWEPGWTSNAGLGSACEDNLFVKWQDGQVRSSITSFNEIR